MLQSLLRPVGRNALGVGVIVLLMGDAAQSAVRVCLPPVAGGPVRAATLTQAQQLAIEAWFNAAKLNGDRFTSWRIANSKSLLCSPTTEAGVMCAARASPCMIQQAPGQQNPAQKQPSPPTLPKVLKPAPKQLNI